MRYLNSYIGLVAFLGYMAAQQGSLLIGGALTPQVTWIGFAGNTDRSKPTPSLGLGAIGRYGLSDRLSLGVDLLFSLQAQQEKRSTRLFSYKSRETYSYLKLPVQAVYALGSGNVGIELMGGLQPMILMGAKSKTTTTYPDGSQETEEESGTEGLNSFVLGIVLGAGLRFELSNNLFFAPQLRFDHSLTNIYSTSLITGRTGTFALFAGLYYQIK
jgi:opacity protein-like surface antigen